MTTTCRGCECWEQYMTRRDWGHCGLLHKGTHEADGCLNGTFAVLLRRLRVDLARAEREAKRREVKP